jgi:hypothetical protein
MGKISVGRLLGLSWLELSIPITQNQTKIQSKSEWNGYINFYF